MSIDGIIVINNYEIYAKTDLMNTFKSKVKVLVLSVKCCHQNAKHARCAIITSEDMVLVCLGGGGLFVRRIPDRLINNSYFVIAFTKSQKARMTAFQEMHVSPVKYSELVWAAVLT